MHIHDIYNIQTYLNMFNMDTMDLDLLNALSTRLVLTRLHVGLLSSQGSRHDLWKASGWGPLWQTLEEGTKKGTKKQICSRKYEQKRSQELESYATEVTL